MAKTNLVYPKMPGSGAAPLSNCIAFEKFADDVREGRYDVTEGVVCKGITEGNVWMVKIKTNAYMQRLKEAFKERWEDYWE